VARELEDFCPLRNDDDARLAYRRNLAVLNDDGLIVDGRRAGSVDQLDVREGNDRRVDADELARLRGEFGSRRRRLCILVSRRPLSMTSLANTPARGDSEGGQR